jgi:hypothetical protein
LHEKHHQDGTHKKEKEKKIKNKKKMPQKYGKDVQQCPA